MIATDLRVEPIVPLACLAQTGCRINWTIDGLTARHPTSGTLLVTVQSGRPQVPRPPAQQLMREFEEDRAGCLLKTIKADKMKIENEHEDQWLQDVVISHPALRLLPE